MEGKNKIPKSRYLHEKIKTNRHQYNFKMYTHTDDMKTHSCLLERQSREREIQHNYRMVKSHATMQNDYLFLHTDIQLLYIIYY